MPEATVVIPTYNRSATVIRSLEALTAGNPPGLWEAVVVDDGSTDATPALVTAWARATGAPVRCLRQANAGPAAARNRGAAAASAGTLIFIDDDILVPDGFVEAHLATLRSNPGCWVVGRVRHPAELRTTPFGRYRDDLWEAFHKAHPPDRPWDTEGISAANLSLPRADFEALGGFDERFTIASSEDWDLGYRARRRGIRILYDPRIVAVHDDWAVALESFCRRQRLYSVSDVLLQRTYGDSTPRSALVQANGPVRWGREPFGRSARKVVKSALASVPGGRLLFAGCHFLSRVLPDRTLTRRAYDAAVAAAIFDGVREGLRRYPGPVRVCHLIDRSVATPYFESIARRAAADRYPVTVGSVQSPGALQESMAGLGTATFSLCSDARWQYPLAILRLVRRLRADGVGILHAHCFDPTALGLMAARLAGTRFVFTRHHSDHNLRLGKRWHTHVDSFCARHADQVIAVSAATRLVLVDREGVPASRVTTVSNGCEPLPAAGPASIAACRRALGLGSVPVCLVPARLHEEKGHLVLFEALPSVIEQVGEVAVLLAGVGPHRHRYEAEVIRRGLTDVVRFLGWRDDMAELIALSTVVVLPSLAESFGFAALEASGLGRAVVASDAGGLTEVVAHGVTGVVVPAGDADALGEAIAKVLADPDWAEALGRAGRQRATNFGFEPMIRGYERVYERVMKR